MNKQIIKWFQNNDHQDRIFSGQIKKRVKAATNSPTADIDLEDDLALEKEHLKELFKELERHKKTWNPDKIVRFLSLTFQIRKKECTPQSASGIANTLTKFPCFKEPVFVSEYYYYYIILCL